MTSRRVVLLPGDGIGPEVTALAARVVAAAGVAIDWDVHEVGESAFERHGAALPASVVEAVREAGVALKGPVSTPSSGRFRSVNLSLRQELDLFVQVRRCQSFRHDGGIDVVVARETTEDVYAGLEFPAGEERTERLADAAGATPGSAITVKAFSDAAVRRATRAVVTYATAAGRRRMTVVHKATAMPATDGLFLRAARDEAAGAMDVDDMLVDLAAAELVKDPSRFDVIFTGNLYGDILADLLGALVGSVGLVPGVNLGDAVAVFEPAHGSAPRHAGHDRVNPAAAILSAALLVRHLGDDDAAARIERAVARVLRAGKQVTYDVAAPGVAPVGTSAMTDAVIAALDG